MTHDERISSYIDNELTAEQEQEFLISLAASDGLRKSFRSELVLKKVLHRDELATTPPRRLRGAVFATLGLSAVGISTTKANAAQPASHLSGGFVKALFASKMSTLATIAGLSISAIAGYGVRSIVSPAEVPVVQQVSHTAAPSMQLTNQPSTSPTMLPAPVANQVANNSEADHVVKKSHIAGRHTQTTHTAVSTASEPVNGMAGGGTISVEPAKINPTH